jgi:hypothetical protein
MKMSCNWLLIAALSIGTVCWVNPANAAVTLEALNPRGEVPPPPVMGIRPRLNDLAGKKIALCENGKMGADVLFEAIAELLKQKYPTATILRMPKPQGSRFAFDAKDWYPEVARQADAFLFGVGD